MQGSVRLNWNECIKVQFGNVEHNLSTVPFRIRHTQPVQRPACFNRQEQCSRPHSLPRRRTPSSLTRGVRKDPEKILATCCSYDGLTSRLCEEAGFPLVFISGYNVASSQGLPDTGYIAMQDMCLKIQEVDRQVKVPIFADGDTGYGSPMNVKRTVQWYEDTACSNTVNAFAERIPQFRPCWCIRDHDRGSNVAETCGTLL